jgi:8-oxo-dGTP diphosphatase
VPEENLPMLPERYNIRVYGICINEKDEVLLTDERRGRYVMTKFPGGGHHFGEGLADALKREFLEEAALEVEVLDLLYINDFLQISAFNPKDQLISIYYRVRPREVSTLKVTDKVHDFTEGHDDCQTFRWVALRDLDEAEFTFPIDKVVVQRIRQMPINPSGRSSH